MAIEAKSLLDNLLDGNDLTAAQAGDLLHCLTDETLPPAMGGALLAALRAKGETPEEVRGLADTLRELAHEVHLPAGLGAADSVGTGGDGSGSLNLSTGTGLLAAAAGLPVIKHGNRSVSSKSGSADVLKSLGIPLAPDANTALACLESCNFAFLFAPFFHPAMKSIAPVRGALGVRTVFNILGPLVNPAAPPFHLIGAFDLPRARLMAEALAGMQVERAFVVHGEPGWDEATPVGPFALFDVRDGQVTESQRDPAEVGLPRCRPEDLAGGDASENARALEAVLAGADQGPHRHALLLGAGLMLEVAGRAPDLATGIEQADAALDAGAGAALLHRLRDFAASLEG
ncbi:MAG: anthranilate phosphoribosyltransferase [Gammaproteobacteria bacterium]